MKALYSRLLTTVILVFAGTQMILAQCATNTTSGTSCTRSSFYYGEILPNLGCGVNTTVTPYSPGEYFRMPVLPGACYTVSTCGASIDTQLGAYEGVATTGPFAYNDDNGPDCTGTAASINMVPDFNDYARVDVRQFNCQPGGTASITVSVRQNNNLNITSSNASMCEGQTRTLTATPNAVTPFTASAGNGGTFTGTGVSGITFTAPTPSGASEVYTITYTYGYCSTSQAVTVFRSPTVANAGLDQMILCDGTTTTLAGNTPTYGSGVWTLVSGTGTITSPTSPNSGVTGLVPGGNAVFMWTVTNGPCIASTDIVTVSSSTDVSAPVPDLASLSAVTAECEVTSLTAPTATDNCGVVTVTSDFTPPISTQGTTVVTWTYDDGNGNTSTQAQNVIITDVTAPAADVATLSDVTAECEVTSLTAPTATDNCGGMVTVTNDATLPITMQGTTVVTWTYDDGNGNTSTQSQNIIITDVTAPAADVATLSDVTAECEVTSLTAPTATDNCGGMVTVTNDATLPITMQGTTVVTWTYDDGNGNTSTQSQNVIITDVTAPASDVATLSDVTAECEVTSLTAPTATDNCGGMVTVTNDATLPITMQGTTVVTWTYDDGNGNTSTQPQNVIITDVTAPAADVATLSDVTAVCEVTSLTAPTATDNCGGMITVTNDATLPITMQGTTVVTWTYDDGNGNTSSQSQNVIITDLIAPTASNPMSMTYECLGDAIVDVAVVTDATDNCLGLITVSHVSDVVTGNGCQDTITRTYNVADESGNNIDVVQLIYINDITLPTASNPSTLNVQCAADVPAPSTGWVNDEADNCGTPTVTWTNDVSDGLTCPETISRTYTVTDNCGNFIDVVQMIIVQDVDAPIFDVTSLGTETAFCDVTLTAPTAMDNCSGAITATTTQVFPINTLGTTTVVWNYIDECGNTSSQTQDVVIESIDVSTYIANDGITIVSSNVNAGVTYQWIDCTDGNTPLTGETNHNFTPTFSHDFAVIVTEDGCSDTSNCVTVTEVGLSDLTSSTLTFYPNPTTDGNFKINYNGQLKSIEVVDMVGRKISLSIDLNEGLVNGSELSDGKYLVRVVTIENQEMIGTIIIQK